MSKNVKEKEKFLWYVNSSVSTLAKLAEVSLYEFNTDYKAAVKMYDPKNVNAYLEIFGNNPRIRRPGISTPPVSYGHLNGVGVPLVFPEGDGEVNYERSAFSINEWIEILSRERDFSKEGKIPFFLEYREKLMEAFPGKNVGFGMTYEGPVTEAYTMLDLDLYYSLYDEPEKLKIMLEKIAYSVIRYKKFYAKVIGIEYKNLTGICDDCAALVPPDMWEDFVIPYLEILYSDVEPGRRSLHCEDMTEKHLKHLDTLGITMYDPSVSPKLNPRIISHGCSVPFMWRMCSIYHRLLDKTLAKDFVYAAVRDGARGVFSEAVHIDKNSVEVVLSFIEACETVERMFEEGATREDIGNLMSDRGKDIFWEKWRKEYIGG
jgi:hypothetical protein